NESYSLEPLPGSVTVIPRRDTILQRSFGAYDGGLYYREPIRRTAVGSVSYVTGSHAFKAGVQYGWGYFWRTRSETADLIQLYRHLAALLVRVGRPGQRQNGRRGGHRKIRASVQHRFRRNLRPELLQQRHAHLVGSERRRHRTGRHFVPRRRHPRAVCVSNGRLRNRLLNPALDVRRETESAARGRSGPPVPDRNQYQRAA